MLLSVLCPSSLRPSPPTCWVLPSCYQVSPHSKLHLSPRLARCPLPITFCLSVCLSVGLREVLCRSRGAIFPVKFKSGLSVSVNFTFESPTPTNQQLTASFFKTKHKIMSRATSFLWGYLTCPGQKGYVSTDEVLSKLVVMELLLVQGIRAIYLPWLVWLLAHPSKGFF